MTSITIGPPVTGEDFFDREELLNQMWEVLGKGSILLTAPRRVGKTSLVLRMRESPRNGFQVVYVTVEDLSSSDQLATELVIKASEARKDDHSILKKMLYTFVSNIEEMEIWQIRLKLREQLKRDWQVSGRNALLDMLNPDVRLVLVIDELPLMILNMRRKGGKGIDQEAVELLGWLRKLRQDPDTGKNLAMVITGSIGIEKVVSHLKASVAINDLHRKEVGPFDPVTAQHFAERLFASRNVEVDEATMEALVSETGTYIPIFIQIMVQAISNEIRSRRVAATPDLVRWCYEERVHGPEYRHHFEDYYERLDRHYTPDESRAAKRILRELALTDEGLSKSAVQALYVHELGPNADLGALDLLITALENDFYMERGEKVRFKNKWLRDWWRRYHAFGS